MGGAGYLCGVCGKGFSSGSNVNKHLRAVHRMAPAARGLPCPLCPHRPRHHAALRRHIEQVHHVLVTAQRRTFPTWQEFEGWLGAVEAATRSRYVKTTGAKVLAGLSKLYYHCHRTGRFLSKSSGKRSLKSEGSLKLGVWCPSQVEATVGADGRVEAVLWDTHVGHDLPAKPLPPVRKTARTGARVESEPEREPEHPLPALPAQDGVVNKARQVLELLENREPGSAGPDPALHAALDHLIALLHHTPPSLPPPPQTPFPMSQGMAASERRSLPRPRPRWRRLAPILPAPPPPPAPHSVDHDYC